MNVVNVTENDLAVLVVVLCVFEATIHYLVSKGIYVGSSIVNYKLLGVLLLGRKASDLRKHSLIVKTSSSHDSCHGLT